VSSLSLVDIGKRFGGTSVLEQLGLHVSTGEFVVLVGASGSGKSTLLNIIAGLERPTRGAVMFDDTDVTALAPVERNVAMVFQSYALYPAMTVRGNLSFPLSVRGVPRREARRRVEDLARRLRIEQLLDRRATDLSGGERQRVAIGRALVRDPAIFLLDEPLSHLDTALKSSMQLELKKLHEDTGGTFVYVTHDPSEAMTLATTIAVLDQGRIVQCDRPSRIYERPATQYVGSLIGSPPMNFLDGEVSTESGAAILRIGGRSMPLCERAALDSRDRQAVIAGFRPEHITLLNEVSDAALSGEVMGVQSTGADSYALIRTGDRQVRARMSGESPLRRGEVVSFAVKPSKWNLFCPATGRRIETHAAA
jgi:multiple sugar transport system ATP-binding protein